MRLRFLLLPPYLAVQRSGMERVYHKSAYKCCWRHNESAHDRSQIERCGNPEVSTHLLEEKVFEMIQERPQFRGNGFCLNCRNRISRKWGRAVAIWQNTTNSERRRMQTMDEFPRELAFGPLATNDDQFWSIKTIVEKTGLSRTTKYKCVKRGFFPRQRHLGSPSSGLAGIRGARMDSKSTDGSVHWPAQQVDGHFQMPECEDPETLQFCRSPSHVIAPSGNHPHRLQIGARKAIIPQRRRTKSIWFMIRRGGDHSSAKG
jgi:predicted DNA-binding transcriptional regulator AlpA